MSGILYDSIRKWKCCQDAATVRWAPKALNDSETGPFRRFPSTKSGHEFVSQGLIVVKCGLSCSLSIKITNIDWREKLVDWKAFQVVFPVGDHGGSCLHAAGTGRAGVSFQFRAYACHLP